jgi:hypothetical protein
MPCHILARLFLAEMFFLFLREYFKYFLFFGMSNICPGVPLLSPQRKKALQRKFKNLCKAFIYNMVPKRRLELPRLAALDPKSSVSTNSTTSA